MFWDTSFSIAMPMDEAPQREKAPSVTGGARGARHARLLAHSQPRHPGGRDAGAPGNDERVMVGHGGKYRQWRLRVNRAGQPRAPARRAGREFRGGHALCG
ncbi:hypothetical protein N1F89_20150 [Aquibium sp. A9E412]|uniref:hypothetical protein n=1 Tax=Aquibium sp. A9E412 TaxID=2976767 RepID=UPI0025AF5EC0|nr:hypothetical protein [Aquibium sp. A9E412]MDN2568542.1 hypothetical protein [Aquibium sp. A9E412]